MRIFPFFCNIRNILQVALFAVGVQMFFVHAFLLKGDEATLPNKLGFTEFHFHANFVSSLSTLISDSSNSIRRRN